MLNELTGLLNNSQINNYILPYFSSLKDYMDIEFIIGVYGTRNVCERICEAGYATTSFVSDMSTGYSGNMGFVIPNNWNYDQYATVNMGNNNEWAIDKDAYSGMFPPVTSLNTYVYTQPAKPIRTDPTKIGALADIIQDLETLEDLYVAWYTPLYQAAPNVLPDRKSTRLNSSH